jgi:glyoxylase-like metal-dependent hydrolase (beta-lactamase superfamily II)
METVTAPNGAVTTRTALSVNPRAAEMRETLEQAVGKKIKVAAILLTHWHYADGTAAWLDEGAELWGHEYLDRNRRASGGVSVIGGYLMSRATAQFGVFHPAGRSKGSGLFDVFIGRFPCHGLA